MRLSELFLFSGEGAHLQLLTLHGLAGFAYCSWTSATQAAARWRAVRPDSLSSPNTDRSRRVMTAL